MRIEALFVLHQGVAWHSRRSSSHQSRPHPCGHNAQGSQARDEDEGLQERRGIHYSSEWDRVKRRSHWALKFRIARFFRAWIDDGCGGEEGPLLGDV